MSPPTDPVPQFIVHEVPGQEMEVELFDKDPDQDDLLGRCGGGPDCRADVWGGGWGAGCCPPSPQLMASPTSPLPRMKLDFGEVLKARVLDKVGAGAGGAGGAGGAMLTLLPRSGSRCRRGARDGSTCAWSGSPSCPTPPNWTR